MKTLYVLNQDIKKTIFSLNFIVCAVITFLLLLTTSAYSDGSTGKEYSVIEAIFTLDHNVISTDVVLSSFSLFTRSFSSYLTMFLPIIAAFPFIPNFSSERNSGLIRFTIVRSGKLRYYLCKFISAFLGEALAIAAGYILYGILVMCAFPSMASYEDCYYTLGERIKIVIQSIIGVGLYGGCSAIPAFLLASVIKNRYLITCIPFMIVYLYTSILVKLRYGFILDGLQSNLERIRILFPDAISQLWLYPNIAGYIILFQFLVILLALVLFVFIMNRRWDQGE